MICRTCKGVGKRPDFGSVTIKGFGTNLRFDVHKPKVLGEEKTCSDCYGTGKKLNKEGSS